MEAGPRERELTEGEEAKLLPVCPPDLRDLIEAGLMTGMREGELIRLTRGQVDLAERLINFPPTKNGLKRLMPINERLYYLLCRRCARLRPRDLILSLGSTPWERWHIRNRLGVAITKAEIPPFRFHDLRHTAASRLRRAGADMDHIRKVLGHRNVTTTDGYVPISFARSWRCSEPPIRSHREHTRMFTKSQAQWKHKSRHRFRPYAVTC
jgi:integrase